MDVDGQVSSGRMPSPELEYGPAIDVTLNAVRLLLKQPEAEYRSENQRLGLRHCLELNSNLVVVMGTGEGKACYGKFQRKLQPHIKNVVLISSAANLINQYNRAKDMGLKAYRYRFSDDKDLEFHLKTTISYLLEWKRRETEDFMCKCPS